MNQKGKDDLRKAITLLVIVGFGEILGIIISILDNSFEKNKVPLIILGALICMLAVIIFIIKRPQFVFHMQWNNTKYKKWEDVPPDSRAKKRCITDNGMHQYIAYGAHTDSCEGTPVNFYGYECEKCGLVYINLNKPKDGTIVKEIIYESKDIYKILLLLRNEYFDWNPSIMNMDDLEYLSLSYGNCPIIKIKFDGSTLTKRKNIDGSRDGWRSFPEGFFNEVNISLNESDVKRIYQTLNEIDFNKWKTENHIIQNYTEQAAGFCVKDSIECRFKNGVSFLCLYPKCEEFKKIIEITEAIIADKIARKSIGGNEHNKESETYLDKIKGSLFGGAVGDALGYPVEFLNTDQIRERYGKDGIFEYELDKKTGKALISDDTQMALFTANGILVAETRACMRGIGGRPSNYVSLSYQDWLTTQTTDFATGSNGQRYHGNGGISWLLDVPELYVNRAPGNTCLSALQAQRGKRCLEDYMKTPVNNSKGCGAVMRIAPLGLHYSPESVSIEKLDREAAEISAVTHGHSLGYMTSSVLTHILNRIVYPPETEMTLKEIVLEARDTVSGIFENDAHIGELNSIIDFAVGLSENHDSDIDNIAKIGEGWVAEETLAIAVYCSLRYQNDFSKGVIAAVNHSGDSDSTGAVTGNILGALLGYDAIEDNWKANLELQNVILEMATDLCYGCLMSEYSSYYDPAWETKYMYMHWKESKLDFSRMSPLEMINSSGLDKINRMLRNGGNG